MDPWLKLKFPKHHEIEIWTFFIVFSTSKCRLSPTLRIVNKQIGIFRDIFDCNKLALSCLKSSTMDPKPKLKFPKHHKIGI